MRIHSTSITSSAADQKRALVFTQSIVRYDLVPSSDRTAGRTHIGSTTIWIPGTWDGSDFTALDPEVDSVPFCRGAQVTVVGWVSTKGGLNVTEAKEGSLKPDIPVYEQTAYVPSWEKVL